MTDKAPTLDDGDREAIALFNIEYGETLKRLGVQIARWAFFEGHSYFGRTDRAQTPMAHAVDALTVVLRESMADELCRIFGSLGDNRIETETESEGGSPS